MDTQTHSAGGLEQDEHVEKKPSYMNRVKARARKIRDSIGSKMQNHDNETDDEDQFLDAPEKVPEVHGEPEQKSPEVKTGSNNLNSGTSPSNLAEHRDADTTREYGETGAPEPKRYSTQHEHAESCPTGLNFGDKTNTEKTKTNLGSVEEPKTDPDVSTPLEVEKAAVIREIDSRPTLDFDDEPVEVPLEAEKTAVILELNSTIPRIDSEKPYKWNLESNSEVSPQLEAEKAAVITEINSSITRMDSEKPYTAPLETNSAVSTPLEADKENAGSTWMDFEKENAEQTTDQIGTDLTDAGAKEADVEPMTRSFGDIDITGKPEPTGTDGHDKFSFDSITHPTATNEAKTQENTEDFYGTKSNDMNVDEEPNVNPTYTENKPSAASAIAASTIAGTAISAKDTVSSKLGYNGNTVTTDAKAMDKEGASIGEETKSSTPSVGDYGKVTESPEVAAKLGTDEHGYERDEGESFGAAPVSTVGGLESPTAGVGMVDRAKGLVNYYWYGNKANNGNEAAVKPDDDVHKVADGGAEEKKQGESHETNTTGVVGQQ